MIEAQLEWLTKYIDDSVGTATLPIDVVRKLAEIGATLTVVKRDRSASLPKKGLRDATTVRGTNGYRVELTRSADSPPFLTHRERFSLAHEWAHILLDQYTGWRPTSRQEYYLREAACNRLAAHLLVPERAQRNLSLQHPLDAVRSAARVRLLCGVSWPVAALRIGDGLEHIVLAELRRITKKGGGQTLRVSWSAGATELFEIRGGKHIGPVHVWSELAESLKSSKRIWMETTVGSQRWALVVSKMDEDRFFAWAQDRAATDTNSKEESKMANFAQLSLIG